MKGSEVKIVAIYKRLMRASAYLVGRHRCSSGIRVTQGAIFVAKINRDRDVLAGSQM